MDIKCTDRIYTYLPAKCHLVSFFGKKLINKFSSRNILLQKKLILLQVIASVKFYIKPY